VTHVIHQPRGGATNSVSTAVGPTDGARRTPDAPPLAAAEPLHIDPAERANRRPNLGDGTAISNALTDPRASESADDSGEGLAMFVIFTGAVLIVTGAVALLALVDSWWMLGLAFGVHLAMTAAVVLAIFHAMAGRTRTTAARNELAPARAGRFEHQPGIRTEPVAEFDHTGPQPAAAIFSDRGSGLSAGRLGSSIKTAPRRPRVLMVTDEDLAEANEVPEPIRPLVDVAEAVYVVAPTLTTRLQSLTGDVDRARGSAQERLRTVFGHMHADGLEPRGVVGDEDQVAAIADALADFDADLMVLRLHARGSERENWREHRLVRRVRSRFEVPTIAFFFDDHGQVIAREETQGRGPGVTTLWREPEPTLSAAS
jgi:hypothetical protein